MLSRHKRQHRIIAAIFGAGLAALIALSLTSASDAGATNAAEDSPSPPPTVGDLPSMASFQQISLYPVLAQPVDARDEALRTSAEAMAALGGEEPDPIGMEPGKVREIGSASPVSVGIVPAEKGICILATAKAGEVTGSCSPQQSLELTGLNVGFVRDGEYFQIGALPATWSREVSVVLGNGKHEIVTADEAGFYAVVTSEPLAELVVVDAEGVEHPITREERPDSPLAVNGA